MIQKLIKATLQPQQKEAFIAQQRVWNDAMSRQRGFLGIQVATDADDPCLVYVMIAMSTRDDLARFMAGDHDPVMEQTQMQSLYDHLEIRVLDIVEPGPTEVRLELSPSRTDSGHQLVLLSELYRASAVLRTAVEAKLFDHVPQEGMSVAALAQQTSMSRHQLSRLLEGLAALNLVYLDGAELRSSSIAREHLDSRSKRYLGDLILHNTRPALWQRWGTLSQQLGTEAEANEAEHELFLKAMSNLASAGQAQALVRSVSLKDARRLLDVGGGHGDYSVALCREHPALKAVLLDQSQTAKAAREFLENAGFTDRIEVIEGDYRRDFELNGFDAVLLSNVLRGETPEQAIALLRRVADAMEPNGLLVIQDLFLHEGRSSGPLLAAMFGLHLQEGANGTVAEVCELLTQSGFASISITPLDCYVGSNQVITARRSSV